MDKLNEGIIQFSNNNIVGAIECFDLCIKSGIQLSNAYFNRALCFEELNEIGNAILDYEMAIKIDTEFKEAYYNLGLLFQNDGSYPKAINSFTRTIEIDEYYVDGYNCRANTYVLMGKMEEAKEDYDKAISIQPDNKDLYYNRGILNFKLGMYIDSINDYAHAITLDTQYDEAYYGRANANLVLGNLREAIDDYTKTLVINPNKVDAYYNRAIAYVRYGEINSAIDDYNEVIKRDVKCSDAYNNLGNIYKELAQFDRAIIAYDNSIKIDPNSKNAYYNKANTYHKQGKLKEAKSAFDEELKVHPDNIEAYYGRGTVYANLGELGQATKDYDNTLKLNKKHAGALYFKDVISFMEEEKLEINQSTIEQGRIFHYTTLESLELILKNHTLRLNALKNLDDEDEGIDIYFGKKLSKYIYISSWTDSSRENISLWNLYTKNMQGVRIEADIDFLELQEEVDGKIINIASTNTTAYRLKLHDKGADFFKKVKYQPLLNIDDDLGFNRNNMYDIGCVKESEWDFQNECRYMIYGINKNNIIPSGYYNQNRYMDFINSIIFDVGNDIQYIDLIFDIAKLKNANFMLGPKASEEDYLRLNKIVNTYIDDYHGTICKSKFYGKIKSKND